MSEREQREFLEKKGTHIIVFVQFQGILSEGGSL